MRPISGSWDILLTDEQNNMQANLAPAFQLQVIIRKKKIEVGVTEFITSGT